MLLLFSAALGPATPLQQMGGQGRLLLQRLADGQPAVLLLLVSSARTGRPRAPAASATAAVTKTGTSDDAAYASPVFHNFDNIDLVLLRMLWCALAMLSFFYYYSKCSLF